MPGTDPAAARHGGGGVTALPSPASVAVQHGPVALKQAAWFARLDAAGITYDAEALALAHHHIGAPRSPPTLSALTARALPATRAAIAVNRARHRPRDDGPEAA